MAVKHPVTEKCFLAPPETPKITWRRCTSTDVCILERDAKKLALYLKEVRQFLSDYNELCREKDTKQ